MSSITTQVIGDKEFLRKLKTLSISVPKEIHDEAVSIGMEIRNKIIKSMRNTKKRSSNPVGGGRTAFHYPSIPYNPPAIDKGTLVGDIHVRASSTEVEVGNVSAPHGDWMEKGTKTIKPRPWLKPAFANIPFQERIGRILDRNVRK